MFLILPMCSLISISLSVYEVNIDFILKSMEEFIKAEKKLISKKMVLVMNQLYIYLINSGSISPIYMNLFIKKDGMVVLRRFQDFCIVNKGKISKNDYDEIRYLLSFIILNLYKHFKANKEFENTTNPFANLGEKKEVGLTGRV